MKIFGVPVFFIVPLLVFGPLVMLVLFKVFRIQTLFSLSDEDRELQRKHRAVIAAQNSEDAKSARFKHPKLTPMRVLGQGALYGLFILGIGAFSNWPAYQQTAPGMGEIKLSLTLLGDRKEPCVTLTREQLMELAPNMRRAKSCPRERWPVAVTFTLDGDKVVSRASKPAGISSDGPSSFYETFFIAEGSHQVHLTLINDGGQTPTHRFERTINLKAGQALAITMDSDGTISVY